MIKNNNLTNYEDYNMSIFGSYGEAIEVLERKASLLRKLSKMASYAANAEALLSQITILEECIGELAEGEAHEEAGFLTWAQDNYYMTDWSD